MLVQNQQNVGVGDTPWTVLTIRAPAVLKKTIGSAQVGDQRKHLAVLLTLRTELDEKGQPTDNLHPEVKNY